MQTEVETKPVTFYSWIDSYPHALPSSITIRVSGGQRQKDPTTGAILAMDHKEVHFNMGILHTDDEETIRVIRGLIKKGDTITEDREVYLQKVMKPEDQARRAVRLNSELNAKNAELDAEVKRQQEEIEKLRAKLAKKGAAD